MKPKLTARIFLFTLMLVFLITPIVCAQEDKIGVFRPSTHQFILKTDTGSKTINWGLSTDMPVTGDWNGDGIDDVGVFRPSTHRFYLKNGTRNTTVNWGLSTDIPVSGDWNGDGMGDVGVFRPSTHRFYLKNGTRNTTVNWGLSTDILVSGDWNGDGKGDVGVFRPSTHRFYLKNGTRNTTVNWGLSTDIPVSGDWNGNGMDDIGVFRSSIPQFILKNGAESTTINWGLSTDIPVTGKWEQTEYKVYAEEGESWGHESAYQFFKNINGINNGGKTWTASPWPDEEEGEITWRDASVRHWTGDEDEWVGKADFLFFTGHGIGTNPPGIQFPDGQANVNTYEFNKSGKVKWVAFDSCGTLFDYYIFEDNDSFKKLFDNGLHMLLGYSTDVPDWYDSPGEHKGQIFAELMKGSYWDYKTGPMTISNAWYWAGMYTHKTYSGEGPVNNVVFYADNCGNDMLPGYGDSCAIPQNAYTYYQRGVYPQYSQGSMNSRQLNLAVDNYSLATLVPVTNDKTMIYKPVKSGYTKEWVRSLAKRLGMSGNISETEDVFYIGNTNAKQFYFVIQKNTSMISFQKLNRNSDIAPSETRSRSVANSFLRNHNLMPSKYLETSVVNNSAVRISSTGEHQVVWKTNVIWYPQLINGFPVFGARSMVEVDSDGNIVGLFKNWREYKPYKEVSLKSPEDAFGEFRTRRLQSTKGIPEKVNVTHVSLGYQMQHSGDMGEYLEPVYIFEGNSERGDSIAPFEPVAIAANNEVAQDGVISPTPGQKTEKMNNVTVNFSTRETNAITTQNTPR